MWVLIYGSKFPKRTLLSATQLLGFLAFVSTFGDVNCSSSCSSKAPADNLELPQLQLLIEDEDENVVATLDHPGDKPVDLIGIYDKYKAEVEFEDIEMTCSAPYPVLLVALMANENQEEFRMVPFTKSSFDVFRVYPYSESEADEADGTNVDVKVNVSLSLNTSNAVFETSSYFPLNVERNISVFACEAAHNPCLTSAGKLVFTNHGKSHNSKSKPLFNFTVKMAENSKPHLHPFLTSSYRSLPIPNFSSDNRNSSRNSMGYSSESQGGCDAIFYYQHVETRLNYLDKTTSKLAYSCEFSDGSPGFVKTHYCNSRGRCNFQQQRQPTVIKNCWRPISRGETCRNCSQIKHLLSSTDPFVPLCVSRRKARFSPSMESLEEVTQRASDSYIKTEDMADGIRVVKGTPLYVGFPSGFNISQPDIRTWDEENRGNERMIRMQVFEEVQLVDSFLQINCDSNDYYTADAFLFALKFQNTSELEFLTVTNDMKPHDDVETFRGTNLRSQSIQIHLNETYLERKLERICCFALVQNSRNWINASRPLRIVPHVQDLFKPSHGQCEHFNPGLESHPTLAVHNSTLYNRPNFYTQAQNFTGQPIPIDDNGCVSCRANYPIEMIHDSIYSFRQLPIRTDPKYSIQTAFSTDGNISVGYEFSTGNFDVRVQNVSQFFRCQSIQNPCLHGSFQFFRLPGSTPSPDQNETQSSEEDEEKQIMVRNFPPEGETGTLKTELGRPSNYDECQVLFFYKEIDDFPGYEFRCEFAMKNPGTITFNYCDSMNECANSLRNRRQSSKCWRKVEAWEPCGSNCQKASGFRPFVATCSLNQKWYGISRPPQQQQQSFLGSFAVFGLPTKPNRMASIYFSVEEIDPREMTYLHPFDPYQLVATKLNVTCTVSAFLNNLNGLKIITYFDSRKEFQIAKMRETQRSPLNKDKHHWTLSTKIELGSDSDLSHIYCIGLDWIGSNSSRQIHLHAQVSPKISLRVRDSGGEGVIGKRGENVYDDQEGELEEFFPPESKHVFLECYGFGYPPPNVSLTGNAVNEPKAELTLVNATHSLSRIFLPIVDVGVEGTYTCTAQNIEGKAWSSMRIQIKYPVNKFVVIGSSVGGFIFVVFLLILLLFVRRLRKIREKSKDLSDEEVEKFYNGDNTVDPTDNNAGIYALAYEERLEIPLDLIEIDEDKPPLGTGNFGIVRSGTLKSDSNSDPNPNDGENDAGVQVAVKIPKFNVTKENFMSFLDEIKIMSFVQNHENVLKILGASTITIKKRRALIALEFCELGNLKNFLSKFLKDENHVFKNEFQILSLTEDEEMDLSEAHNPYATPLTSLPKSKKLDTLDLLNFSLGIANGMNFLAEKKVIHGDLAARNILLTRNREVKISDFGLSTQLKNYQTYAKTNPGSIPWRWFPVEALTDHKFTLKSDCWSFGIVLYDIFSLGEDPYPGFAQFDTNFVQSLQQGIRNQMPKFANDDIFELMNECWRKDPNERPSFAAICEKILDLSVEIFGSKLNLI